MAINQSLVLYRLYIPLLPFIVQIMQNEWPGHRKLYQHTRLSFYVDFVAMWLSWTSAKANFCPKTPHPGSSPNDHQISPTLYVCRLPKSVRDGFQMGESGNERVGWLHNIKFAERMQVGCENVFINGSKSVSSSPPLFPVHINREMASYLSWNVSPIKSSSLTRTIWTTQALQLVMWAFAMSAKVQLESSPSVLCKNNKSSNSITRTHPHTCAMV